MKIVIATPLYPPDIAPPAPYVKELARRLALSHTVTIVSYGSLPEQVPQVTILAVPKNRLLFLRLIHYAYRLLQAAWSADIVYAQNGASVELPAALLAWLTRRPLVVGLADPSAHNRAQHSRILGLLERFAMTHARAIVDKMPRERPEILPFGPKPEQALKEYEESWSAHIQQLEQTFVTAQNHAR